MKLIIKIVKRLVMAFLILYGLNVMLGGLNFYIPINIITVGTILLLGVPGVLGLTVMLLML